MRTSQSLADNIVCPPASIIPMVQCYSIEIAPCVDGSIHVGVRATLFDEEGELECMDLGCAIVRTKPQAIEAIQRAIAAHQFGRRQ